MKQKTRDGILIEKRDGQQKLLSWLYGHGLGRAILKPLTCPAISRAAGWFLSTGASRIFIKSFIRKNQIDMSQFLPVQYRDYNSFFCRQIRPEVRPVDPDPCHFVSPADSKLTVLPISADTRFVLKHTEYTVESLLKDPALAKEYSGGLLMIFRLTVDDYHRYCYVADGSCSPCVKIPGRFHTVNPIANDYVPIYKENSREYNILHSKEFGEIVVMEVGALMVGKIVNHPADRAVRGQEKGYFQFGGSTVVLMTKAGMVQVDDDILQNSAEGIETVVKFGEKIGQKNG